MNKYIDLQLFAEVGPVNITSQSSMQVSWKTFYDTTLLENAKENTVFDQFGLHQPIKGGKCEWRKFNTFGKALTPLTEGVIPTGQNFGMTAIEVAVTQHGDYTTLSDRVQAEMYDDFVFGATEEMGVAMAETKDTLTRNVLGGGNCVLYCPKGTTEITSRSALTNECVLTPAIVHRAATWLIKNKAPKINGSYVAIIHPSVAHDLTSTQEWRENHINTNPTPVFKGEIGELYGVRFVVSNNAQIVKDTGDTVAKYFTLFLGKDAYGVVTPDGESAEMILKTKEQIGGPIEQFGTIGYKFCHATKILYQERLLRVESGSSFGSVDEAN